MSYKMEQDGPYSGGYGRAVGARGDYHDTMSPPPISEADPAYPQTAGVKKGYFGGQQYEPTPMQSSPTELPNTQAPVVHEMGT